MPNNNDDIINNILNELDQKNNAPVQNKTDSSTAVRPQNNPDSQTNKIFSEASDENERVKNSTSSVQIDSPKVRKAPENMHRHQQSRPAQYSGNQKTQNRKHRKKKKKRSRIPGVLILTTFIFAVSICLSLVIIAYGKDMLGIGKSETTHLIVVPDDATTDEIAALLEENDIIKSPEFFTMFSKLSKSNTEYIPGEHFLRPNMAYETIIQELTSDEDYEKKQSVEVTFPEGITLYDAAVELEENGVCSIDDFLFYFNAGDLGFEFEDRLSSTSVLKFYQMEGYLFPDTYYFYEDMDPEQVCQKIYMNFDNKMTDDRYERMEELNLSLDQLITFASIVQKEAATEDAMTMVASVFWNRLNNQDTFPLLQSDPTRLYSENVIKPHMDVYDQVIIDSYNTYVSTGLPPGAICNPGLEAIDAVLEAMESPYFYFIANVNTGQTYFSETLEEHNEKQIMIEEQYAEEEAESKENEDE